MAEPSFSSQVFGITANSIYLLGSCQSCSLSLGNTVDDREKAAESCFALGERAELGKARGELQTDVVLASIR